MQFVNLGFHGRPRSLCSRLLPAHPASLSLGLQRLKVLIDVCRAEVVQNDGLLIEILAPDLGDFALRLGELLVVLAHVELLLDWQQVLNGVEVITAVVEDTADVEDRDCSLVVVLLLRVAAAMVFYQ